MNRGPVSIYGVNDMVLDNWGRVRLWVAEGPVTSHGDSGIGFVNFGDIAALIVRFGAPPGTVDVIMVDRTVAP